MRKFDCKNHYLSTFTFFFVVAVLFCCPFLLQAQVILQGYVYESGNRGYLESAAVTVLDNNTRALQGEATTDVNGKFEVALSVDKEFLIRINKKPFEPVEHVVSTRDKTDGEKVFAKFEMQRLPGYVFEVTLAPARDNEDLVVDAITGAWIEVYNNTTDEEVLNLKDHPNPTFSCRFEQGNHYTVLIRKTGFYNKRLEAYVNVKGCILCFDGVGEVKPGVSEVLTEGFAMGTILANVELQPISMNKEIEINNIYYETNSARLKSSAREELDKLALLLNDNKNLLIEIGSHTDSRGETKFNQELSQRRARSVVDYLVDKGISKDRITAVGYGESKLRNGCGNGVECSEERHARNRRTEFKVIGFVIEKLSDNQSLAQMKEAEKTEKLLAQLEGSEVKIGVGEPLPEDLKKQLQQKELPGKTKPIENEKVLLQEQKTEAQDVPVKVSTKEIPPNQEVNNNNAITSAAAPTPLEEKKEEAAATPVIKDMNAEVEDFEDRMFEEEQAAGIVVEREVPVATYIRPPKPLPRNYNGYKIQIVISTYELPLSHEIFSRHGNIMLEETKKGTYAYLLGDFDEEEEANDFMNNVISTRYPNARVIQYLGGRRLVE